VHRVFESRVVRPNGSTITHPTQNWCQRNLIGDDIMPDDPKMDALPQTAGELRRLIASKGLSWTVDPRLRDTDRLPKRPRGGQEEHNASARPVVVENVAEHIRQHPPINPFLRARWVELKLLPAKSRGHSHGSTPAILIPEKEK
jgi:hypothetical protein